MSKVQRVLAWSVLAAIMLIGMTPSCARAQGFLQGIPNAETEEIGDGLYAFRYQAYRNIFIVSDDGVIATDPINAQAAEAYRAAIAEVTDQPVKYVAYSHSHWDHVSGGQIFKDEGAEFIAHEKCAANIASSPNANVVAPDTTFDNEYTVSVGDRSLDLYYFGPSHDTCLIVMVARPANILFTVDVVSPPSGWYMPFDPMAPDFHFYNVVDFFTSIEDLAARDGITKMVGGHLVPDKDENGKSILHPAVGPITAVTERREFWQSVMTAVKKEMDAGTVSLIVHNKIDLEPFKSLRGYNERNMKILLQRVASYYTTGH